MKNKNLMLLALAVLVLGGYLFYITTKNQPAPVTNTVVQNVVEEPESTPEADPSVDEPTTIGEDEDMQFFEVTGGMFYFDPNEIRVKAGDTVKIVFTSAEGMHDWRLDEFAAQTEITNVGETTEVTFVADTAGSYEFYCNVGNHRAMGMVGTLIVE